MANEIIRTELKEKGVRQWELAANLSIRTDIAGCNKGSHQRRARMRVYK